MRKQTKRRQIIPAINPLVFKLEPSAESLGLVTQWRVELAGIVNKLKDGTFGHHDADRIHEYLSTCFVICRMAKNDDAYDYVGKAAEAFTAILDRKRERDVWIATGDEIKQLHVVMDDMAEALGALPPSTIKAGMQRAYMEIAMLRKQYLKSKAHGLAN